MPTFDDAKPLYDADPGIIPNPQSNFSKEMAKFEQFHSAYGAPGNPYTYRPFPKMLYRAQRYEGKAVCMAAPPDPAFFKDARDFERAEQAAAKLTSQCQKIVKDEREYQAAMEDNWRESPQEALDALHAKDAAVSKETAHRNYDDRNMSELAKREIDAEVASVGGEHLPEIPRKRGRPRKVQTA